MNSCERALFRSFQRSRFKPDSVSYNATLNACEKCQEGRLAMLLLAEIGRAQRPPNVVSVSACISACSRVPMKGALRCGYKRVCEMP